MNQNLSCLSAQLQNANQQLAQSSCGLGGLGALLSQSAGWGAYAGCWGNTLHLPQPDAEGWHDYQFSWPPEGILLQFERRLYGQPAAHRNRWVGYSSDFGPAFNIDQLYWRLTGVGKHQMGAA